MTYLPRIKGRKLHLVIWYSNEDTSIQTRLFEEKDKAAEFYDAIVKRDVVHAGLREEEVV